MTQEVYTLWNSLYLTSDYIRKCKNPEIFSFGDELYYPWFVI